MLVLVHDFVPYHLAAPWQIHDAYYAAKGVGAWEEGQIPSAITGGSGAAAQHAAFLVGHIGGLYTAGKLEADAPIHVLEVGGGAGDAALNLFASLDDLRDPVGQAVAKNLKLYWSDFTRETIDEVRARPQFAELEAAGRIIPCLFDIRQPGALRSLDGAPLAPTLDVVIASYVCCVTRHRVFRKQADLWSELHMAIGAEAPDEVGGHPEQVMGWLMANAGEEGLLQFLDVRQAWVGVDLEQVMPDGSHAEVVRSSAAGLPEATVQYPLGFITFLDAITARLSPHGVIAVHDFGEPSQDHMRGLLEVNSLAYGNSLNHPVQFPILERWARARGGAAMLTAGVFRRLHTAVLVPGGGIELPTLSAFTNSYIRRSDADDLSDFMVIAMEAQQAGDHERAMSFFERCNRHEPHNPAWCYEAARSAFQDGKLSLAHTWLERGRPLPGSDHFAFDTIEGAVLAGMQQFDAAKEAFTRSLAREPSGEVHYRLAWIYDAQEDKERAVHHYKLALEEAPAAAPETDALRERIAVLEAPPGEG